VALTVDTAIPSAVLDDISVQMKAHLVRSIDF
jgi:hypothetical protein